MENTVNSKRKFEDQTEDNSSPTKKILKNDNLKEETAEEMKHENNEHVDESEIKTETKYTRASESDVGITEYISDLPGFSGVIKERYSDFLVNEIDLKENVVRLTNLDKPSEPEVPNKLNVLLKEETLLELKALSSSSSQNDEVLIEVTHMDKNDRKDVHVSLRQSFRNIDSRTEDKDGKKYIIVKKCSGKAQRFQPSHGGNYTHFVLYKENRDTIDAINTISSFLRVQPKIFSYAGTKDKRAKTSQLVSGYRLRPEKLLGLNKHFQMIKVGNIEFKKEQIKLGDLSGNQFVIILRQLEGNEENIEKIMTSLSSKGFINYYGMQRFGTSSVPTHVIGRALLRGDWKLAIDLILSPKSEDDGEMSSAKKIWNEAGDAKLALEKLRRKSSIEAKLLHGLATNDKNASINALNAIPRNVRLLYIHSYQSFIWNQVVSKRIKKYGLTVLKGDLISNSENISEEMEIDSTKENSRKFALSNSVKVLSDEELDSVSISDVLIPLPGHSVVFPDNETKTWYENCLKSDGMSLNNFQSKTKAYSLSGDYRKLIVVPKDVKWKVLSYNDNTLPLSLSDFDVLTDKSLPENLNDGSFKALKVELKLPSSSYATMALHEVLKTDSFKKV